jgi:hypothetical protein
MKLVDMLLGAERNEGIEIIETPKVIGRQGDISTMPAIMNVSREHAKVYTEQGNAFLEDVGSKYGSLVIRSTALNSLKTFFALKKGERVELRSGDLVYLGYQQSGQVAYPFEVKA